MAGLGKFQASTTTTGDTSDPVLFLLLYEQPPEHELERTHLILALLIISTLLSVLALVLACLFCAV